MEAHQCAPPKPPVGHHRLKGCLFQARASTILQKSGASRTNRWKKNPPDRDPMSFEALGTGCQCRERSEALQISWKLILDFPDKSGELELKIVRVLRP